MEVVEILQASLVPIVILSAAGLLSLSMQQRYGRVIDRIRAFHEMMVQDVSWKNLIEKQLDLLIKRGRLLRNSLFFLMLSILFALLSTFFLSFQILGGNTGSTTLILFYFLSFPFS
ncbi:MAG: DUF2721 domain-containing protein [Thermoplasmata archaeon]|nr:DUF2721 domain-containing protein [Thermoplasmata archaeon]